MQSEVFTAKARAASVLRTYAIGEAAGTVLVAPSRSNGAAEAKAEREAPEARRLVQKLREGGSLSAGRVRKNKPVSGMVVRAGLQREVE